MMGCLNAPHWRIAAVAAAVLSAGCAAGLHPEWDGQRAEAPYPLTVGIIVTPEFRNFRYGSWYEPYPIGDASAELLERVFSRIFQRTILLESRQQLAKAPSGLAGAIEPAIQDFSANTGRYASGSSVTYRFTLYSAKGESIASWTEEGGAVLGHGHSFCCVLSYEPDAVKQALEHAMAKIASNFGNAPEIRAWLVRSGVPENSLSKPEPQ